MKHRSVLWAVLVGGSIAGTLDILFAISFAGYNGVPPAGLLQTVASGLLGNAAFSGGIPIAALGLAPALRSCRTCGQASLWSRLGVSQGWCANPCCPESSSA